MFRQPELQVRPVRPLDGQIMRENLRLADQREIQAALGESIDIPTIVENSCNRSELCFTVAFRDTPAFIFGVVPSMELPDMVGVVWGVGTDDLKLFRKDFLEHSRQYLKILHARFPILYNAVDERNTAHVRWLKWMGFSFLRRHETWGSQGLPFIEFVSVDDTNYLKPC